VIKVVIEEDEWYPVFSIAQPNYQYGKEVEITEEQMADFAKVFSEFKRVQKILRPLYEQT
jgi:hypothetical protein